MNYPNGVMGHSGQALAYQYILAGNGVFIWVETRFFDALLPIAPCTVRGLEPLQHHFRLKVPRIPVRLLDTVLTDARRARRPDGGRSDNGLNEVLYQFHHHGQTVQVKKPPPCATGSALALALAGLMHHARQKGIRIELTLADDDKIEEQNIGRQPFGVASSMTGGVYKCLDVALRMNAAYGLDIVSWPERYVADMGMVWVDHGRVGLHLIIGCVDNYIGRQEIAKTVERFNDRVWALDSGNAQFNGQVLIGNTTDIESIQLDRLGLCTGLPSPYLQEPKLLQPEETAQPLSCAEMTRREEQSLMINKFAAAIAAQYVANMVLWRQVSQMGTAFNLEPTVMTPRFVTRETVEACLPAV